MRNWFPRRKTPFSRPLRNHLPLEYFRKCSKVLGFCVRSVRELDRLRIHVWLGIRFVEAWKQFLKIRTLYKKHPYKDFQHYETKKWLWRKQTDSGMWNFDSVTRDFSRKSDNVFGQSGRTTPKNSEYYPSGREVRRTLTFGTLASQGCSFVTRFSLFFFFNNF